MPANEFGMPLVMINMGGEMLYILAQRLEAQEVDAVKSRKGKGYKDTNNC